MFSASMYRVLVVSHKISPVHSFVVTIWFSLQRIEINLSFDEGRLARFPRCRRSPVHPACGLGCSVFGLAMSTGSTAEGLGTGPVPSS